MTEQWVSVLGYEGYYEVSDRGNVRSVRRVVNGRWGPTQRKAKLLTAHPANGRYLKVTLCRDGVETQRQVHTLVLEAFVGEAPCGHECDHIDFDITNNALSNLRWVPRYVNVVRRQNAILNAEQAGNLKRDHALGANIKELSAKYGASERHVYQVVSGIRWKDVA